jgi:23S rRNA (uridine2552-2'-O)-methyltransferase
MKKYYSKITEKSKERDIQSEVSIKGDGNLKFQNVKQRMKNAKGMKVSSSQWLSRQINDPYSLAAKKDGFLSRAAYKLIEINAKFKLFWNKTNNVILDLGSAPGSWLQVINKEIDLGKKDNHLISIDLLDIQFRTNYKNFHFINGDFESEEAIMQIKSLLGDRKATLILSDIAHNNIGDGQTDRLISERIIESIMAFAMNNLADNGKMVCKALQGADGGVVFKEMKKYFNTVDRFKPKSSRSDSSEMYIVATGFHKNVKPPKKK